MYVLETFLTRLKLIQNRKIIAMRSQFHLYYCITCVSFWKITLDALKYESSMWGGGRLFKADGAIRNWMLFKSFRPGARTLLVTFCPRASIRNRRCEFNAFIAKSTNFAKQLWVCHRTARAWHASSLGWCTVKRYYDFELQWNRMILVPLVYILCLDVAIERVKEQRIFLATCV